MLNRIVIFARAPIAGAAKTRLIPALGADGAAALAHRMLLATAREAMTVMMAQVELCVTPAPGDPAWAGVLPDGEYRLADQGAGDLGARLARAAERVIAKGDRVLLIGADCPGLTGRRLASACWELETHDAVIHPTFDGGYALLGLNRTDSSLFEGIDWSTPAVARQTIGKVRDLGWRLHLGETLHDVDEPADLALSWPGVLPA